LKTALTIRDGGGCVLNKLTQERLKEVLHYNPETGVFTWIVSPAHRVKVGDVAGSICGNGYRLISIDSVKYKAHRLAWLYVYGYLPEHGVDHKDRVKVHNQIDNLREASQQCNMRNTGNFSDNTSGVKGVNYHKPTGKWRAYININRKNIYLGVHLSFFEAACHRLAAEQAENWHGCDNSSPAYKFVMAGING
jgi:hypothetical protein